MESCMITNYLLFDVDVDDALSEGRELIFEACRGRGRDIPRSGRAGCIVYHQSFSIRVAAGGRHFALS